ncbi:MAG: OmpA family protein [Brevibacterium sp.]
MSPERPSAPRRGVGRVPAVAAALAFAGAAALVTTVAVPGPAMAAEVPVPGDFTDPDQATIEESIIDLEQNIVDLGPNIEDVESTKASGDSTVVTLSTDILFDFDSAELGDSAKEKIADLVDDIPDGAEVTVDGHTDSKGEDDYNQTLSEDRAEAVADVLTSEDSDLKVKAVGHGESDPVASNGTEADDDPEGRAKNRRVELRYDG